MKGEVGDNCWFILGDESVPRQDEPVGIDQLEPAEKSEDDRSSQPILGEEWQTSEPILDVCSGSRHFSRMRLFLKR